MEIRSIELGVIRTSGLDCENLIIYIFCRSDDNDGTVENSCRMNLEKCIEDAKLSSHSDDLTGFLMPSSTSPTAIGEIRGWWGVSYPLRTLTTGTGGSTRFLGGRFDKIFNANFKVSYSNR